MERRAYNYEKELKIGILQTTVDYRTAWTENGINRKCMLPSHEKYVIDELRKGFKDFEDMIERPHIVLIPEYSIPHGAQKMVEDYACKIGAVVFGGLDLVSISSDKVANKGIIIIPNKWPELTYSKSCAVKYFGKTYFAEDEIEWFRELNVTAVPESTNYIINAGIYGVIGVAICSDFYDLERFLLYRGKIHHLFIIAYNKDYKSFEALSEAISRLIFCNVVICNTGHFGDSLAYSPFRDDYKRNIYKNMGANLFATQVISLPVMQLDYEQSCAHKKFQKGETINSKEIKYSFKWPPGYNKHLFNDKNL